MLLKEKIDLWRDRFKGRQAVFGLKETFFHRQKQRMVTQYTAAFTEKFRTKESRRDVDESNTTVPELYIPLGDNHIENHIKGVMELLIYVLDMDGTCNFAALDFDSEHTFEDVMKCYDMICVAHQISCYVARSTSKGHHLYIFFDSPIEAKYITSYIFHVYEELGFLDMHRNGEKAIPETFPKLISLKNTLSTGLGIKPPMQEKGMVNNMNCWIDAEHGLNEPIGGSGVSEVQWDYLQSTKKVSVTDFKAFLEQSKIDVREIRLSEKRKEGFVEARAYGRTAPYKPPVDGSLMRVINGCPAMKRMWEGPQTNIDFPHMGRVALLSWAMQTRDGLDLVRTKWESSPSCEEQIDYAIRNYQQPWTCRALQEHNMCIKGRDPKFKGGSIDRKGEKLSDFCFKKSPPKETRSGKVIINPDETPETDWADPSPIRLRVEIKTINSAELKIEIESLSKEDPLLGEKITDIYGKILLVRNSKEQSELEHLLKNRKLAKVSELKGMQKEAKEIRKSETKEAIASDGGIGVVNGIRYTICKATGGYAMVEIGEKGQLIEKEFTNFLLNWTKRVHIHSLIDEDSETQYGDIWIGERKLKFQIPVGDWGNNLLLAKAINICGNMEARVSGFALENLRDAVYLFGRSDLRVEHKYEDYGFDSYTNPTVYRAHKRNVTAEGFSEDDESYVDLSKGGFEKYLCIEEISNDEFTRTVKHIKQDLFNYQDHILTYTAVAHSLQATIQQAYLPFKHAPILWVQGTTGSGKTALATIVQNFHGVFPRLVNVGSTDKAVEMSAMLFKDALLVLDDYKEGFARHGIIKLIQAIYDRSQRSRLQKNLKQATAPHCRGLMMITSEDRPTSEASALARCIYIEAPSIVSIKEGSTEKRRNLEGVAKSLSGVTGRFIQYVMVNYADRELLAVKFDEVFNILMKPIINMQNAARVSQNLTANYLTWELFCKFLRDTHMVTKDEYSEYLSTHWTNIQEIRDSMISACEQEQASNVFLETLRSGIFSGQLKIEGMNNNTNEQARSVGFVMDPTAGEVFIDPKIAMVEVKKMMSAMGAPISHTLEAIGRQLKQDGLLLSTDNGRTQVRRRYNGSRSWVWHLDATKLDFGPTLGDVSKRDTQSNQSDGVVDSDDPMYIMTHMGKGV